MDSVCNSQDLRTAHNEMLTQVSAFGAKIPLDPKIWRAVLSFSESNEAKTLDPIDQRLLDETLADFREVGADLPPEKKERLEKLSSELAQATQQFSERVLDATNAWQLVIREESKLKGLPETAKEAARIAALEKLGDKEGVDAWVFTFMPHHSCLPCSTLMTKAYARKFGKPVIPSGARIHTTMKISFVKFFDYARKRQHSWEKQILQKLPYHAEWQRTAAMQTPLFRISIKKPLLFFVQENKELEIFKAEKNR